MKLKLLSPLFFVLFVLTRPVFAANSTTPTSLVTLPTFECISVRAAYGDDDNRNNSATVQWKLTSGSTWVSSYTPLRDVRGRLSSVTFGQDYDNSANSNQFRVSIVGLIANTSYDVQVTFSDSDGITGNASITNTLTTLNYSVLTNGTIRPVDPSLSPPWNEVSNAIANATAGDTLVVSNGTYAAINWLQSGTASGYLVVKAAPGHLPIISGGALTNVLLSASYIVLDGFKFASFQKQGLAVSGVRRHFYIQNCIITNGATAAAAEQLGFAFVPDGCTNVYFLTNRWHCDVVSSTTTNIYAVYHGGVSNFVFAGNTVTGNFWDSCGNGGNKVGNGPRLNCDFAGNSMTGYRDDSIELEGDGINCRFWANTVAPTASSESLLGLAGVWVGPSYVFRNTFDAGSNTLTGLKIASVPGRVEIFHNVVKTMTWPAGGHETVSGGSNIFYRNNIFLARGNIVYNGRSEDSWNYNCWTNADAGWVVQNWNGSIVYETHAAFVTGTGQQGNGFYNDPRFAVGSFQLTTNSPCKDAGVVLQGFNDAASAWPLRDSAPDIGAFELTVTVPHTNLLRKIKQNFRMILR